MTKKRLEDMTQDEVEELLGPPGELAPPGAVWLSRRWECSRCKTVYESDMPTESPVPCACGSIAFRILPDVLH